ncbi:MAG: MFS transporter [Candidatus Eisenbacteria bacterium]|nr:MFS transporter [Candidatus Eisenbacteria bacterium]
MRSGFAALSHRNYRLYWFGSVVSLMGGWMQSVAQSWLVLELTNSTFQVGMVFAMQFLPVLLFGMIGGLFADKFDKRRVLLITQSLAAAQALTLAFLQFRGVVEAWQVMALAAVLGLVNVVDMPTRQSFTIELVGRADVMNAIALNTSAFNLARIVGPAIAGLLIGKLGTQVAFLLNGISFLGVILALLAMRPANLYRGTERAREGIREGLTVGISYIRRTPVVQIPIVLVGVVATFGLNYNVLLPGMARDQFAIGAEGFGLLMSSFGIGSLIAALTVAFFSRLDPVPTMVRGAIGFSLLGLVFAFSPWFPAVWLAALNLLFIGFCMIWMTATANTTIQRTSPDELRGRVMSVYVSIFAGSTPIGSLFAGGLATRFSPQVALAAGSLLSLVAAFWAAARTRRLPEGAMDAARSGASPPSGK